MVIKIKALSLLLFLLGTSFAQASMQDLLDMPTRPSMNDVVRESKTDTSLDAEIWPVRHMINKVAHIIAEFEWAYPGAIWMPLGRDAVGLGDIIDAFYISQGQPGRVIRLNASGPSFDIPGLSSEERDKLIAEFVQSSGVDIKNLKNGPTYVFFDGSNYFLPAGSQSTKILNAVYHEYVHLGGQAKDIIKKFAFINLSNTEPHVVIDTDADREKLFSEQYKDLEEDPMGIPKKTFAVSNYAGFSSEWHDSFGFLTKQPDGSVAALVPKPKEMAVRVSILETMLGTFQFVQKKSFLDEVQRRAKELGYEFKIKSCNSVLE